jgi:hypothetical protein
VQYQRQLHFISNLVNDSAIQQQLQHPSPALALVVTALQLQIFRRHLRAEAHRVPTSMSSSTVTHVIAGSRHRHPLALSNSGYAVLVAETETLVFAISASCFSLSAQPALEKLASLAK